MRLIDADKLNCKTLPKKLYPHLQAILDFIDSQPTVEERKVGKWIVKDGKKQGFDIAGIKTWYIQIVCNKCGFTEAAIEGHTGQLKYCPCCGVEMVGVENEVN